MVKRGSTAIPCPAATNASTSRLSRRRCTTRRHRSVRRSISWSTVSKGNPGGTPIQSSSTSQGRVGSESVTHRKRDVEWLSDQRLGAKCGGRGWCCPGEAVSNDDVVIRGTGQKLLLGDVNVVAVNVDQLYGEFGDHRRQNVCRCARERCKRDCPCGFVTVGVQSCLNLLDHHRDFGGRVRKQQGCRC